MLMEVRAPFDDVVHGAGYRAYGIGEVQPARILVHDRAGAWRLEEGPECLTHRRLELWERGAAGKRAAMRRVADVFRFEVRCGSE